METEYWIIVNDQPAGPYTHAQLNAMPGFTPETMVWYESLTDWIPASQIASLADICRQSGAPDTSVGDADTICGMPDVPADDHVPGMPPIIDEPAAIFSYGASSGAYTDSGYDAESAALPARPANFLGWSIASVLLFFPTGIIALLYSIRVNRHYNRLDLTRAERCAERTQWWIMISIVLALISFPLRILIGI